MTHRGREIVLDVVGVGIEADLSFAARIKSHLARTQEILALFARPVAWRKEDVRSAMYGVWIAVVSNSFDW